MDKLESYKEDILEQERGICESLFLDGDYVELVKDTEDLKGVKKTWHLKKLANKIDLNKLGGGQWENVICNSLDNLSFYLEREGLKEEFLEEYNRFQEGFLLNIIKIIIISMPNNGKYNDYLQKINNIVKKVKEIELGIYSRTSETFLDKVKTMYYKLALKFEEMSSEKFKSSEELILEAARCITANKSD